MAATIYDVAKLAKVGIGTVSRAINNSPSIRPETKKRVEKAIKKLDYKPHMIARGLARKRSNTIAAIMPFYTGYFYHELLRGFQNILSQHEYDLIFYYADGPSSNKVYFDRTLREKRCDGVLAISIDVPDEYIEKFQKANLPLVLVDRDNPNIDCILVKNSSGAYTATTHLIESGHERIAMITGNKNSRPGQRRFEGFKQALQKYDVPFYPEYFLTADQFGKKEEFLKNDGFNAEIGSAAMKKLLELPQPPTALFAAADIIAFGAMRTLDQAGIAIPQEMAIIGFDDIELAAYMSITTMQQPMFDIGRLAITRILEKIEKKDNIIRMEQLSTKLIRRRTT